MDPHNPYRSPTAALEIPLPRRELEDASRGLRLGCAILDGLLVSLLFMPILLALFFASGMASGGGSLPPWFLDAMQSPFGSIGIQFAFAAAGFLLFLLVQGYPLSRYGQTWAKRWFGIRIVDLDGRKPEFVRLVMLRYLAFDVGAQVPCFGVLLSLADPLFIFGEERRCLHDLLAGTRVVVGSPDAAS